MNRRLGALPVIAFLPVLAAPIAGLPSALPDSPGFSPERVDAPMQRHVSRNKLAGRIWMLRRP